MDTVIVLKSWNDEHVIRHGHWTEAIKLGKVYCRDWERAVSLPPEEWEQPVWKGGFSNPLGQKVKQIDAGNLAYALRYSLLDLPDQVSDDDPLDDPWNTFTGRDGKLILTQLIDFCLKSGGFRIFPE